MKVSREQVAENRRKILSSAARLFRERGFDAVTLIDVMKEAGLTHGGFYGHFKSKEDLMAQACAYAVRPPEEDTRTLLEAVSSYLSPSHREHRAEGCAFASLGVDVLRQSGEARHVLTEGLRQSIHHFSRTAPGATEMARRAAAIASFSAMLGGLVLARMSDDPALSDEILGTNREALALTFSASR